MSKTWALQEHRLRNSRFTEFLIRENALGDNGFKGWVFCPGMLFNSTDKWWGDQGIVCVTGCCHQNILTFANFAQKKIVGGENMYGVYGGLHIAPFGPMNPDREHIVKGISKYNFQKIACNHCTGLVAVQRMIELGYPVVRGTGRFGSKSDLHIGNGDEVLFG